MNKRSEIWYYYDVVDQHYARCKACESIISYKTTTSNLRKHLTCKHPGYDSDGRFGAPVYGKNGGEQFNNSMFDHKPFPFLCDYDEAEMETPPKKQKASSLPGSGSQSLMDFLADNNVPVLNEISETEFAQDFHPEDIKPPFAIKKENVGEGTLEDFFQSSFEECPDNDLLTPGNSPKYSRRQSRSYASKEINNFAIKERILKGELIIMDKCGRSKVWSSFGTLQDMDGVGIPNVVACKTCFNVFRTTHPGCTSNLSKHKCCRENIETIKNNPEKQEKPEPTESSQIDDITKFIIKWLTSDNSISLRVFEDPLFRKLTEHFLILGRKSKSLDEFNQHLPELKPLESDLNDFYAKHLKRLNNELSWLNGKGFSLTVDTWKDSISQSCYISLHIHFLKERNLCNHFLGVIEMERQDPTSQQVEAKMVGLLKDFGCKMDANVWVMTKSEIFKGSNDKRKYLLSFPHLFNDMLDSAFQKIQYLKDIHKSFQELLAILIAAGFTQIHSGAAFNFSTWKSCLFSFELIEKYWVDLSGILLEKDQMAKIQNINLDQLRGVMKILKEIDEKLQKLKDDQNPTLHLVYIYFLAFRKLCQLQDNDSELEKNFKKLVLAGIEKNIQPNMSIYHKIALYLFPPGKHLIADEDKLQVKQECLNSIKNLVQNSEESSCQVEEIPPEEKELFQDFFEESNFLPFEEKIRNDLLSYEVCCATYQIDYNLMEWWCQHQSKFPMLFDFACIVLSIPATSSASEKIFIQLPKLLRLQETKHQQHFSAQTNLNQILFLHGNQKSYGFDQNNGKDSESEDDNTTGDLETDASLLDEELPSTSGLHLENKDKVITQLTNDGFIFPIISVYKKFERLWDTTNICSENKYILSFELIKMYQDLSKVCNPDFNEETLKLYLHCLRRFYSGQKLKQFESSMFVQQSFFPDRPLLYLRLNFLRDHIRPYVCYQCNIAFTWKSQYRKHLWLEHNGELTKDDLAMQCNLPREIYPENRSQMEDSAIVLEGFSKCSFPEAVSEPILPKAISKCSFPKAGSERILPETISKCSFSEAVSEYRSPQEVSDNSSLQGVSDNSSSQENSDNSSPEEVSDNSSSSDNSSPEEVSDNSSPGEVSDKSRSKLVSRRGAPKKVSNYRISKKMPKSSASKTCSRSRHSERSGRSQNSERSSRSGDCKRRSERSAKAGHLERSDKCGSSERSRSHTEKSVGSERRERSGVSGNKERSGRFERLEKSKHSPRSRAKQCSRSPRSQKKGSRSPRPKKPSSSSHSKPSSHSRHSKKISETSCPEKVSNRSPSREPMVAEFSVPKERSNSPTDRELSHSNSNRTGNSEQEVSDKILSESSVNVKIQMQSERKKRKRSPENRQQQLSYVWNENAEKLPSMLQKGEELSSTLREGFAKGPDESSAKVGKRQSRQSKRVLQLNENLPEPRTGERSKGKLVFYSTEILATPPTKHCPDASEKLVKSKHETFGDFSKRLIKSSAHLPDSLSSTSEMLPSNLSLANLTNSQMSGRFPGNLQVPGVSSETLTKVSTESYKRSGRSSSSLAKGSSGDPLNLHKTSNKIDAHISGTLPGNVSVATLTDSQMSACFRSNLSTSGTLPENVSVATLQNFQTPAGFPGVSSKTLTKVSTESYKRSGRSSSSLAKTSSGEPLNLSETSKEIDAVNKSHRSQAGKAEHLLGIDVKLSVAKRQTSNHSERPSKFLDNLPGINGNLTGNLPAVFTQKNLKFAKCSDPSNQVVVEVSDHLTAAVAEKSKHLNDGTVQMPDLFTQEVSKWQTHRNESCAPIKEFPKDPTSLRVSGIAKVLSKESTQNTKSTEKKRNSKVPRSKTTTQDAVDLKELEEEKVAPRLDKEERKKNPDFPKKKIKLSCASSSGSLNAQLSQQETRISQQSMDIAPSFTFPSKEETLQNSSFEKHSENVESSALVAEINLQPMLIGLPKETPTLYERLMDTELKISKSTTSSEAALPTAPKIPYRAPKKLNLRYVPNMPELPIIEEIQPKPKPVEVKEIPKRPERVAKRLCVRSEKKFVPFTYEQAMMFAPLFKNYPDLWRMSKARYSLNEKQKVDFNALLEEVNRTLNLDLDEKFLRKQIYTIRTKFNHQNQNVKVDSNWESFLEAFKYLEEDTSGVKVCQLCRQIYRTSRAVHLREAHVFKEDRIKCSFCGSFFLKENLLRRHIRKFHPPAEVDIDLADISEA